MKKRYSLTMLALAGYLTIGYTNAAVIVPSGTVGNYDPNSVITTIYGTGNPNTNWASATTTSGNPVTVALRLHERGTANYGVQNGAGNSAFDVGTTISLDFSANSGGLALNQYQFILSADTDPTVGVNYTQVDISTAFNDNIYGTSGTGNGGGNVGTAGTSALLLGSSSIEQNSELPNWITGGIANPPAPGTYDFVLTAYALGDTGRTNPLASTRESLTVVPEPSSAMALGLSGLGLIVRRRRK